MIFCDGMALNVEIVTLYLSFTVCCFRTSFCFKGGKNVRKEEIRSLVIPRHRREKYEH